MTPDQWNALTWFDRRTMIEGFQQEELLQAEDGPGTTITGDGDDLGL